MPYLCRSLYSTLSYPLRPLLLNIKQAQALNSSATQSASKQTSRR